MKLDSFKMLIALIVISSRFPIGVETMYKPFFKSTILILLTIIISCSPQNYSILQEDSQEDQNLVSIDNNDQKTNEVKKIQNTNFEKSNVLGNVEILLPKHLNSDITQNLLNAFELSIYVKQIKNINLSINFYDYYTINDRLRDK